MASSDNYTGIQQVSLKLQTPKLQLGSVFQQTADVTADTLVFTHELVGY